VITRSLGTRIVASLGVAGAVAFAATGCSYMAPTATLIHYDPADGVGADLGQMLLRNLVAVTGDDGGPVNVIFSAINTSDKTITLHYSAPTTSGQQDKSLDIKPGLTNVGDGGRQIVITTPDGATLGGLYPVTFTADGADSVTVEVPVLDPEGREYLSDYVPKSAS